MMDGQKNIKENILIIVFPDLC